MRNSKISYKQLSKIKPLYYTYLFLLVIDKLLYIFRNITSNNYTKSSTKQIYAVISLQTSKILN